jgi:SAM-dependent methyltransferase
VSTRSKVSVPDLPATRRFYEDLASGRVERGLFGYQRRFDPTRIPGKPSVQRHFVDVVAPLVKRSDTVLDLGCGPGGFLVALAPYCGEIVGVDLVSAFVERCQQTIAEAGLTNARACWSADGEIPFPPATFDAVIMVDTIHHCEDPKVVLDGVRRVLKPGGLLIVFEPNKWNPALALMCVFDRNEWGLLALGSRRAYRKLLAGRFDIRTCAFSGLLVGPESSLARRLADFFAGRARTVLGWLSPKIFIAATPIAPRER